MDSISPDLFHVCYGECNPTRMAYKERVLKEFKGPIVGKIYDSNGPRNIILVGSFLHVFGLMMASISSTYYQVLLSQGVCSAIGVACIFQPGASYHVYIYFPE